MFIDVNAPIFWRRAFTCWDFQLKDNEAINGNEYKRVTHFVSLLYALSGLRDQTKDKLCTRERPAKYVRQIYNKPVQARKDQGLNIMVFNIYVAHFLHKYNHMRFTTLSGGLCQTANAVYSYFRLTATKH